jgi:hypothetical protein
VGLISIGEKRSNQTTHATAVQKSSGAWSWLRASVDGAITSPRHDEVGKAPCMEEGEDEDEDEDEMDEGDEEESFGFSGSSSVRSDHRVVGSIRRPQ